MKILVIGSKGFIGSHVYHSLMQTHEVWGCDVVTDYAATNYFLIDATNSNFDFIFQEHTFDVCINCSGASSVPDSFVNPSRDFVLNVVNVQCMLDAIRKYRSACKFMNLSSAAVYGNPSSLPVVETAQVKPLSPYGWHKYYAEQICEEYFNLFKIRTCSLRIFSAFGPGLKKQIFWDWFQKSKRNSSLQIFGTGNESRDFIFIDDLVHAIECIIKNSQFNADIINVASGISIKISQASAVFRNCIDHPMNYTFDQQVRLGDPLNWEADISKLRSYGYEPQVMFEEGLSRYVQWAVNE